MPPGSASQVISRVEQPGLRTRGRGEGFSTSDPGDPNLCHSTGTPRPFHADGRAAADQAAEMPPGLRQHSLHSTQVYLPSQPRGRLFLVPRRLVSALVPQTLSAFVLRQRHQVPRPRPAQVTNCFHFPHISQPWPGALRASQIRPPRPPPQPIPRKTVGFPLPPAPVRPPLLRSY